MSQRTRRDLGSRGAKCDAGAVIRNNIKPPGHSKANPAVLPSPPSSRPPTTTSHRGSMSRPVKDDGNETERHSCPHCPKQFRRLCDLNKHAKAHIRPFKCSHVTCTYSTLGWPTRKELERHVNDKHELAPQTFPCLFQPCPYKSKRESNCKQHMEKTHGYTYVRCKYNGTKLAERVKTEPPSEDAIQAIPGVPSLNLPKSPKFHTVADDFLLFPEDADHTIVIGHDKDGDHELINLDDRDPYEDRRNSQVFIPWTSPSTRFRANVTLLRRFSQAYEPSDKSVDDELLIDLRLSQIDPNLNSPSASMIDRLLPSASSSGGSVVLAPPEDGTVGDMHSSNIRGRAEAAAPTSQGQAAATSSSNSTNPTGPGNPGNQDKPGLHLPPPLKQDDDDDDDNGEDRPRKRLKRSETISFRDTEMPDIFFAAHPKIYNRDKKALYGSCHSTHKDISTLVRHLGRAPHKLNVHERFISSFDVQDDEHRHPKVGLCRRCWVSFSDRGDFDRHVSVECEKTSKGKREKWEILYNTFTPIHGQGASAPSSKAYGNPVVQSQISSSGSTFVPSQPQDTQPASATLLDQKVLATPSQHPTTADPAGQAQNGDDGSFVSMSEYRLLQEKVQGMTTEVQGMKRLMAAIILQNGRQGVMASSLQPTPNLNAFNWTVREPQDSVMGTPAGVGDVTMEIAPDRFDRGSLVGYMNSQSTDVDPKGLMDEVERTLSRANSGVGSDRSALRHVPTSPPARTHEDADVDPSGSSGPSRAHGQPQPPAHQPTSIPDSGYGSDKKRDSLGEIDLVEQLKRPRYPAGALQAPPPPPPAAAAAAVPSLHPHDALLVSDGDHNKHLPQQDHHPHHQHQHQQHPHHHHGSGTDQKGGSAAATFDPPTMITPYMSESAVAGPGWEPESTYVNEFVGASFSPYGPGNEFPFHDSLDFDGHVFPSED